MENPIALRLKMKDSWLLWLHRPLLPSKMLACIGRRRPTRRSSMLFLKVSLMVSSWLIARGILSVKMLQRADCAGCWRVDQKEPACYFLFCRLHLHALLSKKMNKGHCSRSRTTMTRQSNILSIRYPCANPGHHLDHWKNKSIPIMESVIASNNLSPELSLSGTM